MMSTRCANSVGLMGDDLMLTLYSSASLVAQVLAATELYDCRGASLTSSPLSLYTQAIDKLEEMLNGGLSYSKFGSDEYISIYT